MAVSCECIVGLTLDVQSFVAFYCSGFLLRSSYSLDHDTPLRVEVGVVVKLACVMDDTYSGGLDSDISDLHDYGTSGTNIDAEHCEIVEHLASVQSADVPACIANSLNGCYDDDGGGYVAALKLFPVSEVEEAKLHTSYNLYPLYPWSLSRDISSHNRRTLSSKDSNSLFSRK